MRRYSTLDFVIKDETHMFHFFNYVYGHIYHLQDEKSEYMRVFRWIKFKMKLGFECWRRQCKLQDLIKQAIMQTIDESRALAIANLQKHLYPEPPDDGAPVYSQ